MAHHNSRNVNSDILQNQWRYIHIILMISVLFNFCSSQDSENQSFFEYSKVTLVDDAAQVFNLGVGLVQAPFQWQSNDFIYGFGMGLATGSLFLVDPYLKEIAQQSQSAFNNNIFEIDNYFNGRTGSYAAAGLYLGGFVFRQEKIRLMGLHAFEALFISNSVTGLLKYSFGRRRPYAGESQMDFKAFRGSKAKYRAFPSGHTTNAFAFATVMAMSLDNIYWKTGWYSAASMVGLARIYHNVHWLSDTFFAAVISYNVADFVVHFNKDEQRGFHFYPSFNGLQLRVNF